MPAASPESGDLGLLRVYEPVVRFTKGELFLPTAVGPYVEQCSLWAGGRAGEVSLLVPQRQLTLQRLSQESAAHRGRRMFLRFVDEPLGSAEYLRWLRIPRERLSATGRFTTTGVFGRLVDAGLRASLLLRGWRRPLRPPIASASRLTGSRITDAWCATAVTSACSTGSSTR
jgi:hypothetical protein